MGEPLVRELADRVSVTELHGNKLGLPKLELIAADLRNFFASTETYFVFTALEKAHVANESR